MLTNQTGGDLEGMELCEKLAVLPFWCNNTKLHEKKPDTYHEDFCCVTHVVGLPRHSATNEEMTLTPYQLEFCNKIIQMTAGPQTASTPGKLKKLMLDFKRKHHFFHLNKGRQMGFTEIVLRLIQYFCFTRYAGSNVGIIAGTNGRLAHKDLRRFARLFRNIKPVVLHWIRTISQRTLTVIELVNGTVIEAFKADEEAMTGDTRYKCIFMDEAAKWRLVDDEPVFNSVVPIVEAAGGDLFLISTPKGPTKKFYEIWKDKDNKEYHKFEYDIYHTVGNLYTKDEVDIKVSSKSLNPKQEYLCEFVPGKGSVMDNVTDDERSEGWDNWTDLLDDDEDDNFDENMHDWDDIHEK